MKRHIVLLAFAILSVTVILQFGACHREPVYIGDLLPDPNGNGGGGGGGTVTEQPCSPDSVYFEQQLLPILQSNCAVPGCHDAATQEEGIDYETFASTRNTGKINLGSPASSKMYKVLIDNDPDDRMPPAPRPALSNDQIALVLKWIQQGAQNLHCDSGCDTTNVTFNAVVSPLIATNCKGCHGATNPGGNIKLTNYAEIKAQVDNGKLWGSIIHQNGLKPMPYPIGRDKIPQCQQDQIRIWIAEGAQNN